MANVGIDKKTRERLRNIGRKQQTYDEIINELLDKVQNSSLSSGKPREREVL